MIFWKNFLRGVAEFMVIKKTLGFSLKKILISLLKVSDRSPLSEKKIKVSLLVAEGSKCDIEVNPSAHREVLCKSIKAKFNCFAGNDE